MYSLDSAFNELIEKIRDPDALNPAKSDPVFYFAYPPELMLELKKRLPRWLTRIKEADFEVRRVSLAEIVWDLVDKSGRWEKWLKLEKEADPEEINNAVRDALRNENAFIDTCTKIIRSMPRGSVVLVTEAELLHPFFRTRLIESYIHDKVEAFTVFIYPGVQSGQFGLKFLGFYPVDPNYRSSIIGGTR
jgi:hypothetical protein